MSALQETKPNLDQVRTLLPKKAEGKELSIHEFELALHTINSISECISITDMNDIILYVNKSFVNVYGFQPEEVAGKHIKIVRSEKNDPAVLKEIQPSTAKERWHGRIWNKRKNGEEFLIELNTTVVKDEKGIAVAYVGVARDLTEQLKAEALLLDTQSKYENLFTEIKDVVYESTPDGKFTSLNPAGYELFGISVQNLNKPETINSLYINQSDRKKFRDTMSKNGFVKDYEIVVKNLRGEIKTLRETSYAVKDAKGEIVAYRGILRDITQTKEDEAKLKRLIDELGRLNAQLKISEEELRNTNAAKDKFFSIIAHDLRSPFSSLLSFSEFLSEDIDILPKSEIKLFADKIHEAAKGVFSLLENLLQWSKIQSGKIPLNPVSFNILNKINQVVVLLSNNACNKKIRIINEVSSTPIVFADESMIFSVVQNLLSNAIKFTRPEGIIKISSADKGSEIEISVADNGVGIKEEDLNKLFRIDAHHTTYGTNEEKGSGLGLILCKEMVERNGGKIRVVSKEGEGTTFSFTLPKHKVI